MARGQLTREQIASEVHAITHRDWPFKFLPMKNLYDPIAQRRLGALRKGPDGVVIPIVFPSPAFHGEAFADGSRSIEFGSLEDLVRSGWVVD